MVGLGRVDQERVAEVDVAGASGGVGERAVCGGLDQGRRYLQPGDALLAVRLQQGRYVEMRADSDACRGVRLADLAEQEQHQQGAVPGAEVRVRPVRTLDGVAALDVPARVVRLLLVREPQRKAAQRVTRRPAALAHQQVERLMQHRRVDRGGERALRHVRHPVHRLRPGARVVRVASRLPPQQPCAVLGDARREGALELHEPVFEEALHECVVHTDIVEERGGPAHPVFAVGVRDGDTCLP